MPDWLIKYLTWIFVFFVCIVPATIGVYYLLKIILMKKTKIEKVEIFKNQTFEISKSQKFNHLRRSNLHALRLGSQLGCQLGFPASNVKPLD